MRASLVAILLLSRAPAAGAEPLPSPAAGAEAVHALFDRHWDRSLAENPTWASTLGDPRHGHRWPDLTPAAIAATACPAAP